MLRVDLKVKPRRHPTPCILHNPHLQSITSSGSVGIPIIILFRNHILLVAPDVLSGYRTRLFFCRNKFQCGPKCGPLWSRRYEHSISSGDARNHKQTARGKETQIQHWSRREASRSFAAHSSACIPVIRYASRVWPQISHLSRSYIGDYAVRIGHWFLPSGPRW